MNFFLPSHRPVISIDGGGGGGGGAAALSLSLSLLFFAIGDLFLWVLPFSHPQLLLSSQDIFSTPSSTISTGTALSLVGVLIVSVIQKNLKFAIFVICIAMGLKLSLMYDTTHMPLMRELQAQCIASLLYFYFYLFYFIVYMILYTLLNSEMIKSTSLCSVISKVCVSLPFALCSMISILSQL